jgi:hypothetical protein
MYAEFVEWVEIQTNTSNPECDQSVLVEGQPDVQLEALIFFNKKQAFDVLGVERSNKIRLKENLSGTSTVCK